MGFYEVREFYGEEVIAYRKLASMMFRAKMENLADEEACKKTIEREDSERSEDFFRLGAFHEGELYAGLEGFDYTVNFDGNRCKMSGIGGVISYFDSPEKGAMKEIFSRAFRLMRERGQYLSHLYPFSENYYRQYGYEVTCQKAIWPVPMGKINCKREGRIAVYDGSERMQQEIINIYERFSANKNMSVVRDGKSWERIFGNCRPYVSGVFSYVHYNNAGVADAFLSYSVKSQGERPANMEAEQLWYTDFTGLKSMVAYFETQKAYCDKAVFYLPAMLDLSPLIDSKGAGSRKTKCTLNNDGCSRVVDVEEILKMAAYRGEGSVCIRVYDDIYAPWNNDCFTVTFGEKTSVVRGGTPDIEMKINSFTAGILGRFDFENLLLYPDVKVHNPKDLEKVFYRKTLWIEEGF